MTITVVHTHPNDFLTVGDLDAREFEHLMHLAASMKHGGAERWTASFPGQMISCWFETSSARTRTSFGGAAARLGMTSIWLGPDELQPGRDEPIADTARVLASYSSAIVVRTADQGLLEELASGSDVPVINALTDEHHPCQALADFLTLRERFGNLSGLRLAYLGGGDNVAHSLMEAGALAGVEIVVACPASHRIDAVHTSRIAQIARQHPGHVSVVDDPREAVAGADAVYSGRWAPMG